MPFAVSPLRIERYRGSMSVKTDRDARLNIDTSGAGTSSSSENGTASHSLVQPRPSPHFNLTTPLIKQRPLPALRHNSNGTASPTLS